MRAAIFRNGEIVVDTLPEPKPGAGQVLGFDGATLLWTSPMAGGNDGIWTLSGANTYFGGNVGIGGFIVTAIVCAIYNEVAKRVGGIEVERS